MNILKLFFPALAVLGMGLFVAGCGDSAGPDPKTEQVRVDKAVKMRSIFDKAAGDSTKVDAADKAEFDKLAGGTAEGEKAWNEMKTGPNRGASAGPTP